MNKNIALVFCLFFLTITTFGQNKEFINEWIATEYQYEDGSPIYDPEIATNSLIFNVLNENDLIICSNGLCSERTYTLENDKFKVVGNSFEIKKLDQSTLELLQTNIPEDLKPLKIILENKKFYDLTISPNTYYAKNGELVYTRVPNLVEPYFINKYFTPMDFVYANFRFPEYKKGGFVVRFVITKQGEINGVRIIASSDKKYNNRLINAILKTKGKWKPGTYNGQKVNIELEYDFNLGLGYETPVSEIDSLEKSDESLGYAKRLATINSRKNKEEVEKLLNQSIKLNPYNIEAYYELSSYYFNKNDKTNGCIQLKTLITLEQKEAEKLFEEKCN